MKKTEKIYSDPGRPDRYIVRNRRIYDYVNVCYITDRFLSEAVAIEICHRYNQLQQANERDYDVPPLHQRHRPTTQLPR